MHINFLIYLLIIYVFSSAATDTSVISTPASTSPTAPTSPTPTSAPTVPTAPTPITSISNPAASTSNPAAASIRFEKNYLNYDLNSDEFEARDEIAVLALKLKYKEVQSKSK